MTQKAPITSGNPTSLSYKTPNLSVNVTSHSFRVPSGTARAISTLGVGRTISIKGRLSINAQHMEPLVNATKCVIDTGPDEVKI